MGVFKRVRDIFSANVNAILDQAENPEAMINQIIRELEVTISDLKCSSADKLAEKKQMERQIKEFAEQVKRWGDRAETAVKSGKDALAKEALKEKAIVSNKFEQLKDDFDGIDGDVEQLRADVLKLEEKLVEMINRKKELLSRAIRAEERNSTNSVINKASGADILEKFSRFESKIERMEAEAEVFGSNADSEFENMERESQIDEELEKLKAKLKDKK